MVPPALPEELIVIGSGAIGAEFASFYRNMGAEVTLIEVLDRILPVEDAEISAFVRKSFEKQGMKILTGAKSQGVRKEGRRHHRRGRGGQQGCRDQGRPPHLRGGHRRQRRGHRPEGTGVKVEKTHVASIDEWCRTGEPAC
jgi:dihydrolipoamide dehydrogenase